MGSWARWQGGVRSLRSWSAVLLQFAFALWSMGNDGAYAGGVMSSARTTAPARRARMASKE